MLGGLVGMNTDREPHPVPGCFDRPRALPVRRDTSREAPARTRQPRLASARHDGIEIAGELLAGEMAVGINHFSIARGAPPPRAASASLRSAPLVSIAQPL